MADDGVSRLLELSRRRRGFPPPAMRRLLRERGMLTQRDVAAALGVARPAVSRWERRDVLPADLRVRTEYRLLLERLAAELDGAPAVAEEEPAI